MGNQSRFRKDKIEFSAMSNNNWSYPQYFNRQHKSRCTTEHTAALDESDSALRVYGVRHKTQIERDRIAHVGHKRHIRNGQVEVRALDGQFGASG